MNYCAPDFREMDDDNSIPNSGFSRLKKPSLGEEDIMELLWQNGQIVVQRSSKKPALIGGGSRGGDAMIPAEQAAVREVRPTAAEEQQHLFMQEDEMSSWLHYPLDESSFDRDLYADIFYSTPPPSPPITTVAPPRAVAEIRPPPAPPRPCIPPPAQKPENCHRLPNFGHFSKLPSRSPRNEPLSQPSLITARELTVVESNETPMFALSHTVDYSRTQVTPQSATAAVRSRTSAADGELPAVTCELTVTSSPSGSGASFTAATEPHHKPEPSTAADERKRKVREADDNECPSEDIDFEATEGNKKQASTKRSRAAEVHNLSERRRRDRINEKMRALQELIPRCNKTDKASMLDEAIEYLKSLQLQVQMMSMGCGMVPIMYPGMQQYMTAMGMGMGMNRPMVPYPSILPGSAMPNPAAAGSYMGPRFPIPAFHLQQVPLPDPSRIQAASSNQNDHTLNSMALHNANQPRMASFVDPYQHFLGLHQTQIPTPQSQAVSQNGATKPSMSKEVSNPQTHQPGRK